MVSMFESFYVVVGENIKKYRLLRNYSLQILADKVGLTKKTIQRYETATIKIDYDRIVQLAAAMDISIEKLLEGANPSINTGYSLPKDFAGYCLDNAERFISDACTFIKDNEDYPWDRHAEQINRMKKLLESMYFSSPISERLSKQNANGSDK